MFVVFRWGAAAIRQCFCNVNALHRICAVEIGNCTRDFQDAMIGAGGQGKLDRGVCQQRLAGCIRRCDLREAIAAHIDVQMPRKSARFRRLRSVVLDRARQPQGLDG